MARAYHKRIRVLFNIEWEGNRFIGLCSKTCYCFGPTTKFSIKGLNKKHNLKKTVEIMEVVQNRRSGDGKNRGFGLEIILFMSIFRNVRH